MHQGETFDSFDTLYVLLENSYIHKYAEFDNNNHCYFSLDGCLPFVVDRGGLNERVNLRDGRSGEVLHIMKKERDFDFGEYEFSAPYIKIFLYFRSGYRYILILSKRD